MAEVFHLLGDLGLHGKVVRYHAIGAECGCREESPQDPPCPWDWRASPPVGMLAGAQAHRPVPSLAASGLDTIRPIVSIDLRRSRGTMRTHPGGSHV